MSVIGESLCIYMCVYELQIVKYTCVCRMQCMYIYIYMFIYYMQCSTLALRFAEFKKLFEQFNTQT